MELNTSKGASTQKIFKTTGIGLPVGLCSARVLKCKLNLFSLQYFKTKSTSESIKMNGYYDHAEVADKYTRFRPTYSSEVADIVMKFCGKQNDLDPRNLDLMIDVGCGTGQSTNIFQPYFKKIIGIDISPEHLKQAKQQNKFDNITYLEGSAESIPIQDHTVDLVTVGTAAHWFDLPKFFEEVERVLKPETGCLTIMCCAIPTLTLNTQEAAVDENVENKSYQLLKNFLEHCAQNQSHPILASTLQFGYRRYANIFEAIPFKSKKRDDSYHLRYKSSVGGVCQWISSCVAYHFYMEETTAKLKKKNQIVTEDMIASIDPLPKLRKDLLELLNLESNSVDDCVVEVDFHMFILLASIRTAQKPIGGQVNAKR